MSRSIVRRWGRSKRGSAGGLEAGAHAGAARAGVLGRRWAAPAIGVAALSLVASACTSGSSAAGVHHDPVRHGPHRGGTLTVLENATYIGDWPEGLDPATNLNALANGSLMDAIYGELFQVGTHNKLVFDLASGYKLSNGAKTLTIDLRHGTRFSDGTPFNAAAVIDNFRRDLAGASPAKPAWPAVTSMKAAGPYTVIVNFAAPDGAAVNQFQDSNANWIASPSALAKLGAKRFALKPVGAGPFEVVSDVPNNKLVLKRNPHYWQAGHPYLDGLVFLDVSSDESALETLKAGGGQVYEFMDTPQLVSGFTSAGFTVTRDPGTGPLDVQINTAVAPFNNIKAREALYFATDSAAIDKSIMAGTCPITEGFTGPGGLFYEPKVPGYRTYDPAKAKALVRQLGGISFTMYYGTLGQTRAEAEALQTMYQNVGMKVKIAGLPDLAALIQEYDTHTWQVIPAAIGAWDPAASIGVAFRLASHGPFTGVFSKQVDKEIAAGEAGTTTAARQRAYDALAGTLSKQADTPFICAPSSWDIAKKGVRGPGLTSVTASFGEGSLVLWQDVSMGNT